MKVGGSLFLQFVGNSSVLPEPGGDTACFVLNGHVLVDAGWCAALNMRQFGIDPLKVDHLILTHAHHDHYLGLPQLLFYWGHIGPKDDGEKPPFTIVGPAETLEKVVKLATDFLMPETFPGVVPNLRLVPLAPGDTYTADTFTLHTCRAKHPVPALSYRYIPVTGPQVVFSGDTAYNKDLENLATGADILIHEASLGSREGGENHSWGHSGAPDAAKVAAAAGVDRLFLIHCAASHREQALLAARTVFPQSYLAEGSVG